MDRDPAAAKRLWSKRCSRPIRTSWASATTAWRRLRRAAVAPGTRVGVIGLGGLGHLAVGFARALGAEVTVLSSSPSKADDARALGADRFVTAPEQLGSAPSLDFLLATAPADLPWDRLLDQLRPFGSLGLVGVPPGSLTLDPGAMIDRQLGVFASMIGSRATIREMLSLAAETGVRARVERMPLAQAQAALERVREGRVRHRMVLEV